MGNSEVSSTAYVDPLPHDGPHLRLFNSEETTYPTGPRAEEEGEMPECAAESASVTICIQCQPGLLWARSSGWRV